MKSRINRDAREISISELWCYVISKWKWLVIGAVVGALVTGGVGAYKAYSANNVETPKDVTMENLTAEEQEEVKELIEDYELYKEEEEKLENNYLMNLDYNNISYYLVTYYVDTDYSYNYLEVQENYAATLISMYKTYLYSDEVVREKVMALNIEGIEEIDLTYLYATSSESNIVKIGVYADDECAKIIMDTICEALEEYYTVAEELVGEHKLIKISEDNRLAYVEQVKNGQNFKMSIVTNLKNEIDATKSEFSPTQLMVYEKEVSETAETKVEVKSTEAVLNVKYIIIGAICGILAGAVIGVILYLSSKKVKSINDIKQVYDIEIIGKIIRDGVSGNKTIRKINKIKTSISEKEQQKYVAEMVANKCKSDNINEVVICSTVNGMNDTITELVGLIKESGIECKKINCINYDSVALNEAAECKNVILLEQVNVTNIDDLDMEIETCDKLSLNILGIVVVI